MCGIIAIQGKNAAKVSDTTASAMLATLRRRGPDDQGFDRFPEAVIGQTRLSIVDLERGHQPMRDNTKPISIVFNGEIYGYKDLRADLEKKGHRFSTQSDTEVILKAYAEYGEECVRHIDGMFAFAIWDEDKQHLFIARDRFGKKPFYYAIVDGTFYAASEIKALFASGLLKGEVDPDALNEYLQFGYIPPYRSVYKNVFVLLPAHAGIVKDGIIDGWRYWKLEKKEIHPSYDDAKAEVKRLFDESVKKRMVADVEVGSLLSGGIDSTLVTMYAQKYSSFPIKTFAVGYDGKTNELPYALEASKKIGTDHYPLPVSADLSHELEDILSYMDEPHGDSSDFPQHLISKLAASKVKVALSGDGADELFMGYGWYQKHWHIPRWKPSRWLRSAFSTYMRTISVFDSCARRRLLKTKASSDRGFKPSLTRSVHGSLEKINIFDLVVYLPGQLLAKVDRTGMMHSLEVRSPFLDTALAEYVYNLPTAFKLSKTKNKILLKDLLSETFPKEFVYRRKQGFGAPVAAWLKTDKMMQLTKDLFEGNNDMYAYIEKKEVLALRDDFYAGDAGLAQRVWILLSLALWFRSHADVIA